MDAIQKILACRDAQDYFGMLDLERPSIDALDRPVWNVSSDEIARAYRKATILVHPDKIEAALVTKLDSNEASFEDENELRQQARDAFDALRQGRTILDDPDSLERVLKASVEKSKKEKEVTASGLATLEQRVSYMSDTLNEKKRLREKDYEYMNQEIMHQMLERRNKGVLKKKWKERRDSSHWSAGHGESSVPPEEDDNDASAKYTDHHGTTPYESSKTHDAATKTQELGQDIHVDLDDEEGARQRRKRNQRRRQGRAGHQNEG